MHTMSSKNMAAIGNGIGGKFSGVLGLRRLALGDAAFKGLTPGGPMSYVQRMMAEAAGGTGLLQTFKEKGLAGVLGQENHWGAKIVGGSTGLTDNLANGEILGLRKLLKADNIKTAASAQHSNYGGPSSFNHQSTKAIRGAAAKKAVLTSNQLKGVTLQGNNQYIKGIFGKADANKWIGKQSWAMSSGGKGLSQAGQHATRYVTKMSGLKAMATVGKGVSNFLWLSFAYDMASLAAKGVVSMGSAAASKIEEEFGTIANSRQEFGGALSAGYISSRATTERQRALSAMRAGYGGRGLQGNEAGMMHQ